MATSYELNLVNPDVGSDSTAKNIIYLGKPNTLNLILKNNSGYAVGIGDGGDTPNLKVQITSQIVANLSNISVDNAWRITTPPAQQGNNWVFVITPNSVINLNDQSSLTITLQQLTPTSNGYGTIQLLGSGDASDLKPSSSIVAQTPVQDGDQILFGEAFPLTVSYDVNRRLVGLPTSTTPIFTNTRSVSNGIHAQIVFQPNNLPKVANQLHPGVLVGGFDSNNAPYFTVTFPFDTFNAQLARYENLTDAYKVSDVGYNAWTSGWNIRCSLLESDPDKSQNDFWKIELDQSNLYPVWKIYPLYPNIFTSSSVSGQPGLTLDLYFSHIYSDLPVNQDKSQTYLFFRWFGFKDQDSKNQTIVNYSDGGEVKVVNKLPVPSIKRFEVVPETYLVRNSTNSTKTLTATYATPNQIYGVYPPTGTIFVNFRWLIETNWATSSFQVKFLQPGANLMMSGGPQTADAATDAEFLATDASRDDTPSDASALAATAINSSNFIMGNSQQYQIDIVNDSQKLNQGWDLEIIYNNAMVGQSEILPFVGVIDFLTEYLLGKAYVDQGKLPNNKVFYMAVLSSTVALWYDAGLGGLWIYGSWSLVGQNDGTIQLTIQAGNNSKTLIYDPFADSWNDNNSHLLTLSAINWVGLSTLRERPIAVREVPSLQTLNNRLYIAYRQLASSQIMLASSADGWNWTLPQPINTLVSTIPPSMVYFRDAWVLCYGSNGAPFMTTSKDGQIWTTPQRLDFTQVQAVQLIVYDDELYLFTLTNRQGLFFENSGGLYLVTIDNTAVLKTISVVNALTPRAFLATTTISQLTTKYPPTTIQGTSLPNNGIAVLHRPAVDQDFNSQLKVIPSGKNIAQAADQPALNYWQFTAALTFFRNYLFRISELDFVNFLLSYRTFFNWLQPIAGSTALSSVSAATFVVDGETAIFVAYLDSQNNIRIQYSQDGNAWTLSNWNTSGSPFVTAAAVSLYVYNWILWLAYVDPASQRVFTLTSSDGNTWKNQLPVSMIQTTVPPTLFINPSEQQLYMAIVNKGGQIVWYVYNNTRWTDAAYNGNAGLPSVSSQCVVSSFQRRLFAFIVDANQNLGIYYVMTFGNQWTPISNITAIKTDTMPAAIVLYNQLILVYRDASDQYLKMVRSIDGQNWSAPESLYVPASGMPALAFWNDRLSIVLQSSLYPNMISHMTSAGLNALDLSSQSIVHEVTALMPSGSVLDLATYYDPSGNPAYARLYLFVTSDANHSSNTIYEKQTTSAPYGIWANTLGQALPTLQNYSFRRGFFMYPNGYVGLRLQSQTDGTATAIWLLASGATQYTTNFGTGAQDIAYNPVNAKVYKADQVTRVFARPINQSSDWAGVDQNAPGGNIINITIAASTVYLPSSDGMIIVPCGPAPTPQIVNNTGSTVQFTSLLAQTVYVIEIKTDGTFGQVITVNANSIAPAPTPANNGQVWLVSKDQTGKDAGQCVGYYKLVETPFKRLTVTAQGNVYAIYQSIDVAGMVYCLDSVSTLWVPVGTQAVSIAADQSGSIYAATSNGQILKVTRVSTSTPLRFTIVSMGDTFLNNIQSIGIDTDGIIWVLTENAQVFRGLTNFPTASDPDCDLCVYNGQLYLAYRRDQDIKVVSSQDGTTWSAPVSVGVEAKGGVSLTVNQLQLWVGYISPYPQDDGQSNPLFIKSSADGLTWPVGKGTYFKAQSPQTPALRSFNTRLGIAFVTNDGQNKINLILGPDENNPQTISVPGITTALSTAYLFSTVYVAYRDSNQQLVVMATPSGKNAWNAITPTGTIKTIKRPMLTVVRGILVLGIVNDQNQLQLWKSTDGQTFVPQSIAQPILLSFSFAMCGFRGEGDALEELYIVFVDSTGVIRTRSVEVG